jgi:hypothetical protein
VLANRIGIGGWDALKRCTLQNFLNARPASRRKAAFSQIRLRDLFSQNYLRMPSFPMTVL